jgi:hypothetical protein
MVSREYRLAIVALYCLFRRPYGRQIQDFIPSDKQIVVPAHLLSLFIRQITERSQL